MYKAIPIRSHLDEFTFRQNWPTLIQCLFTYNNINKNEIYTAQNTFDQFNKQPEFNLQVTKYSGKENNSEFRLVFVIPPMLLGALNDHFPDEMLRLFRLP